MIGVKKVKKDTALIKEALEILADKIDEMGNKIERIENASLKNQLKLEEINTDLGAKIDSVKTTAVGTLNKLQHTPKAAMKEDQIEQLLMAQYEKGRSDTLQQIEANYSTRVEKMQETMLRAFESKFSNITEVSSKKK